MPVSPRINALGIQLFTAIDEGSFEKAQQIFQSCSDDPEDCYAIANYKERHPIQGWSPLAYIITTDPSNLPMVRLLLQNGADINSAIIQNLEVYDAFQVSADLKKTTINNLKIEALNKIDDVLNTHCERGRVFLNAIQEHKTDIIQTTLKAHPHFVNFSDPNDDLNHTPLYYAIKAENTLLIKMLLDGNANVDVIFKQKSGHGITALDFAAEKALPPEILEKILEKTPSNNKKLKTLSDAARYTQTNETFFNLLNMMSALSDTPSAIATALTDAIGLYESRLDYHGCLTLTDWLKNAKTPEIQRILESELVLSIRLNLLDLSLDLKFHNNLSGKFVAFSEIVAAWPKEIIDVNKRIISLWLKMLQQGAGLCTLSTDDKVSVLSFIAGLPHRNPEIANCDIIFSNNNRIPLHIFANVFNAHGIEEQRAFVQKENIEVFIPLLDQDNSDAFSLSVVLEEPLATNPDVQHSPPLVTAFEKSKVPPLTPDTVATGTKLKTP